MSTGGWGATRSTCDPTSIGTLLPRSERDQDADEWRLVRALRDGDEAVFVELVRRHHSMLRRMARVYVADDAADRLAQDAWSRAIGQLDRLGASTSIRVALLAILHEQARCRRGLVARSPSSRRTNFSKICSRFSAGMPGP
jgi:hypothetical protein